MANHAHDNRRRRQKRRRRHEARLLARDIARAVVVFVNLVPVALDAFLSAMAWMGQEIVRLVRLWIERHAVPAGLIGGSGGANYSAAALAQEAAAP